MLLCSVLWPPIFVQVTNPDMCKRVHYAAHAFIRGAVCIPVESLLVMVM